MIGQWKFSKSQNSPCQIIEEIEFWEKAYVRAFISKNSTVIRLPLDDLQEFSKGKDPEKEVFQIKYITAAARISSLVNESQNSSGVSTFLSPIDSNIIPLPHQMRALSRAFSSERLRYLLADEVGLGKTIEAGLILRELKLRGKANRILVIAPKSLATQWISEMRVHFNEEFNIVQPENLETLRSLNDERNPWKVFNQVVTTLDSIKPLEKRKGWSKERVRIFNSDRFEAVINAEWDLIIVDESHRLGGSTDQVARFKLGQGIAEAAPYLLLLSATPHQGKTDAFQRLMSLLDSEYFPDVDSITKERVANFTIRTEKRNAVDGEGKPLFQKRMTNVHVVPWNNDRLLQKELYEAVSSYVKSGYNQALKDKKQHVGFLMILMQRLVTSSSFAIKNTLSKRLAYLTQEIEPKIDINGIIYEDQMELFDLDGQSVLDQILGLDIRAIKREVEEVKLLIQLAERCIEQGPDIKADALLELIYTLQNTENEPNLKLLIFTEFVPTQEMLRDFLESRGIPVATLNGSMTMDERQLAQRKFKGDARVLISTDAGGEGLNLQFCHVVINYDMPWNPMRIEQRIGRVDRIGQDKVVKAYNFLIEDTVEYRVREVLEQKLTIIFQELGVDKTADVLDSAQSGQVFDNVYIESIANPEKIDELTNKTVKNVREHLEEIKKNSIIKGLSESPSVSDIEIVKNHPLPDWVERMTISYLKFSENCSATKTKGDWTLTWPDGYTDVMTSFKTQFNIKNSPEKVLGLDNPRVQSILEHKNSFTKGDLIPIVFSSEIDKSITGTWGLFEVSLNSLGSVNTNYLRIAPNRKSYFPVFISTDGSLFTQTARHIWDIFVSSELKVTSFVNHDKSNDLYDLLFNYGVKESKNLYLELEKSHKDALRNEEERGNTFFTSKRSKIEKLGLPEVRNFRLRNLDFEKKDFENSLRALNSYTPDVRPLLLARIGGD